MIQYIYFVKCPNCEDEHFDFFDDAKGFALGCLSKKPIITQTEVCRNDFGECTDSSDLGTVWSWEDEMQDTETEEQGTNIFTRGDFSKYNPENDPEFADDDSDFRFVNDMTEALNGGDLDEFKKLCDEIGIVTLGDLDNFKKETGATDANLIDKLKEYRAELGPDFKIKEAYTDPETECIYNDNIECTNNEDCTDCPNNPKNTVYNGKTLKELVEEMEENEDEVECTWCNDLFPKDLCKKEVNLGWLCSRCADGIMSRGETLTFKENNYWDFLDEDAGPRDPFDHHDPEYDEDEAADYMADLIDGAKDAKYDEAIDSLDESRDPFDHHDPDYDEDEVADIMADQIDRALDSRYDNAIDSLDEEFDGNNKVDLEYMDLTVTVYGPKRDVDDWDEWDVTGDYTYKVDKTDIATTIWENWITEEDAADVEGGLETLEDNDEWEKFLEVYFDDLLEKYYDKLLDYYEDDAKYEASRDEDFLDNY
jgi:hypothetical protein